MFEKLQNLKSCLFSGRAAENRGSARSLKRRKLSLESLEERALLAVLMVNSTADNVFDDDQTTLREAVFAAADGDTIKFDASLSGEEIHLLDTLSISKSVTIDAMSLWNGAANKPGMTVADNNQSQLIFISDGCSVQMSGLRITGGNADFGGAIAVEGADLSLDHMLFERNTATHGAALYVTNSATFVSTVAVSDSVFTDNNHKVVADEVRYGGAIYADGGHLSITRTEITANRAEYGGALYVSDAGHIDPATGNVLGRYDVEVTITDSQITDNVSDLFDELQGGSGGGIYVNGTGVGVTAAVLISGSVVSGNIASVNGGGLYNNNGFVSADDTEIAGNKAKNEGGGLYLASGQTSFDHVTIAGNIAGNLLDNTAGCGGGVYSIEGFSAVDTLIVNNYRRDGYECNVYPVSASDILGSNSIFSTADAPEFVAGPTYAAGWTNDLWKTYDLRLTSKAVDQFGGIGANPISYDSDSIYFGLTDTVGNIAGGANVSVGDFYAAAGADSAEIDASKSFIYKLVAGEGDSDNGLFAVENGELRTIAASEGVYQIRVRATDADGFWAEKTFSVTLEDHQVVIVVNDAGDVAEWVAKYFYVASDDESDGEPVHGNNGNHYGNETGNNGNRGNNKSDDGDTRENTGWHYGWYWRGQGNEGWHKGWYKESDNGADNGDSGDGGYEGYWGLVANSQFSLTDTANMTLREALALANSLEAEGKQATIVFDSALWTDSNWAGSVDDSGKLSITLLYGSITITHSVDILSAKVTEGIATLENWAPSVSVVCGADVLYTEEEPSLGSYNPEGDLFVVDAAGKTVSLTGLELVGRKETAAIEVELLESTPSEGGYTKAIPTEGMVKESEYLSPAQLLSVTTAEDVIDPYDGKISLREAIEVYSVAGGSNTVTIGWPFAGTTFLLDASIVVSNTIQISTWSQTTFKASEAFADDYLFSVRENGSFSMVNSVLDGSNIAGGVYNRGTFRISGDSMMKNGSATNGGAIYNMGTATAIHTTISNNAASLNGGAIYNLGHLNISGDTSFVGNVAGNKGGAVFNAQDAAAGSISCKYTSNEAGFAGGAVYNLGLFTSNSDTFSLNCAYNGGGIYNAKTLSCISDMFLNNHSVNGTYIPLFDTMLDRWAIYNTGDATFYKNDTGFWQNTAGEEENTEESHVVHSGVDLDSVSAKITVASAGAGTGLTIMAGSLVAANGLVVTGFNDSGIKNSGQTILLNSKIAGNVGNLGAVYSDGDLTVIDSSISGNLGVDLYDMEGNLVSAAAAGGIYSAAGSAHLANVTIAGNMLVTTNSSAAAGLYALGTTDADNTLIVQNRVFATKGDSVEKNVAGSGYDAAGSAHSIIAEQAQVEFAAIDALTTADTVSSWNYDLWKSWNLVSASASVLDAGADDLALNGAGETLRWDLNGMARFGGSAVDIGAYEYQTVPELTLDNNRILQQYVGYVGDISVLYDASYIDANDLPAEYRYQFYLDDSLLAPEGEALSNDRFTLTDNGALAVIEPGLAPGYYYIGVSAENLVPIGGEGNSRVFTIIVTETPSTVVTTTLDVVDPTDGLISLREAVEVYGGRYDFEGADTITFALTDETGYDLVLNDTIHFTVDVTLDASASAVCAADGTFVSGVTISAADNMTDELFWVNGNTVDIKGLRFSNGATALVTGTHSFVTVSDSMFENFTDTAIHDSGSLVIENSVIRNNSGSLYGAIVNLSGPMTIRGSKIYENTSAQGGGGIVNYGSLFLGNCSVAGNRAFNGDGGGVLNYGRLTVFSTSLAGNIASGAGGGLAHEPTAENIANRLTLINTIAAANQANNGGGFYITGTNSQLTNCTIVGNIGTSADVPLGAGINVDLTAEQASSALVNLYNTIVAANYNSVSADQDNICPTDSGMYNCVNCLVDGTVPVFKNFNVSSYGDLANIQNGWKEWDLSLAGNDTAAHDAGDTERAISYDGTRLGRDFNNDARLMGEAVDIGAMEYSVKLVVTTLEDEFDFTDGAYLTDGHVNGDVIDGSDASGLMRTDIVTVGTGLSLREAVYWVSQEHLSDVVIVFHERLAGGTITLNADFGAMDISNNITISAADIYNASARENGMTISGGGATRLFTVADSAALSLSSLNLANGNAGTGNGGAIYLGSDARLDMIFMNVTNSSAANGGAIYALAGSDLKIDESFFGENSAVYSGGAVYSNGNVAVRWSDFDSNRAKTAASSVGGAIAVFGKGSLLVEGGSFTKNVSERNGGAIYLDCTADALASIIYNGTTFAENHADRTCGAVMLNAGTLAVSQVTFSNNSADNYAGALYTKGRMVVSETTVSNNSAAGYGGAVYVYGPNAMLLVSRSEFVSNAGLHGGAIAICGNASAVISDQTVFRSNEAKQYGGAIGNWGNLEVTEADFIENRSTGTTGNYVNGGAIGNAKEGTATLKYVRFVSNSALYGGGVHNGGTLNVYACEFIGNSATENGGAISNMNSVSTLNFISGISDKSEAKTTSFTGNTAGGYGGAIINGGTMSVDDSNGAVSFVYFKSNVAGSGNDDAYLRGSAVCENRYSASDLTANNVTLDSAFESGDADAVIQAIWSARYQSAATVSQALSVESLNLNQSQTLLLDVANNGEFVAYDPLRMTVADLGLMAGTHEIAMKIVDEEGSESQTSDLVLSVFDVALPSVEFVKSDQLDGKFVMLKMSLLATVDFDICKWVIHWGDGQSNEYDLMSKVLTAFHYYTQAGDYEISFETVDRNGAGAGTVRSLVTHSVAEPVYVAAEEAEQTAENVPALNAPVYEVAEMAAFVPVTLKASAELAPTTEHTLSADLAQPQVLTDRVFADNGADDAFYGETIDSVMELAWLDSMLQNQSDYDFLDDAAENSFSQDGVIDPENYLTLNI